MRPELQDIVDEAARVLQADTTLEDKDFNLVAYGTQRFDVDSVRRDSILQRRSSRAVRDWFEQFGISASSAPLRTPMEAELGFHARICCPARWRGVTYGYLWALDDHTPLDDPAVLRAAQLAEHAGAYLAQLSRQHTDDAFAVSDLISSDLDQARAAATRIGDRGLINPRSPVVAVVVGVMGSPDQEDPADTVLSPNLWSLPRAVLADRGPTTTTLLVPLRQLSDDTAAREAAELSVQLYAEELGEDAPERAVAGIGEARADLGELRASWVEARHAARVAAAVPSVRPVARWADLGLYRLLTALPQVELARLVLDAPVRRLLDALDPELVQTVRVYLDHAGNVQETAAVLHIHRQTLYYRLSKAENITRLSLGNGHDRSRLHLGLMLAPLLELG
ncbi:MAG TPA: helix-turn-helix domain-containing protein [Propionibacteriaceae bacterium]